MTDQLAEYKQVQNSFDSAAAARKYAARKNVDNPRNVLEQNAILECMDWDGRTSPGNCLDIPCGTFRLGKILLDRNLQITASDYSTNMLEQAMLMADSLDSNHRVNFSQQDIRTTGFESQSFDLIICNRLFHHYSSSTVRVTVLNELRRLCRDLLVISYFDSLSLSNAWRRLKHISGLKPQKDRFAISRKQLRREAELAGFEVVHQAPIRRFISPQTYATLRPVQCA